MALYSLRGSDGLLDERLSKVQVITMATPFITVERKTLKGGGSLFALISAVFLTLWAAFFLLGVAFLVATLDAYGEESAGAMWTIVLINAGLSLTAFALVLPIWLSPLVYREDATKRRYFGRLFGRTAEQSVRTISAPAIDRERLTVFRAAGDEASGLLGLTHLLTWFSRRLLAFGWLALLACAAIWAMISICAAAFNLPTDSSSSFVSAVLGTVFVLSMAIAVVLYGSSIFLAWDTAFLAPHIQMTAESSPPGAAEVHLLRTPPGLLAHGLYTSQELIDLVKTRVIDRSQVRSAGHAAGSRSAPAEGVADAPSVT